MRFWTRQPQNLAERLIFGEPIIPRIDDLSAPLHEDVYRLLLERYNAEFGKYAKGLVFGIAGAKTAPDISVGVADRLLELEIPKDTKVMVLDNEMFTDIMRQAHGIDVTKDKHEETDGRKLAAIPFILPAWVVHIVGFTN